MFCRPSRRYHVAPISGNDVWAVGSFAPPAIGSSPQTLAIHWDGTKWSKVASPNVDAFLNRLFGVAAISTKDVWAVGAFDSQVRGNPGFRTLTQHTTNG